MELPGAVWGYLKLPGAISNYLELPAAIWSYLQECTKRKVGGRGGRGGSPLIKYAFYFIRMEMEMEMAPYGQHILTRDWGLCQTIATHSFSQWQKSQRQNRLPEPSSLPVTSRRGATLLSRTRTEMQKADQNSLPNEASADPRSGGLALAPMQATVPSIAPQSFELHGLPISIDFFFVQGPMLNSRRRHCFFSEMRSPLHRLYR